VAYALSIDTKIDDLGWPSPVITSNIIFGFRRFGSQQRLN